MSLIKSAASLAFTPLTDSFRVGFITVEPKDSPTAGAINSNRFVPLADFDTTQRGLWFGKLFSQSPFGASPAREGLSRVGRYYANQHDGINTGMDGDPMQYSCQQNFTIMTTDGYWNAQTETPTSGSTHGGPLKIDGVTPVGQQDGDPTCPLTRPVLPAADLRRSAGLDARRHRCLDAVCRPVVRVVGAAVEHVHDDRHVLADAEDDNVDDAAHAVLQPVFFAGHGADVADDGDADPGREDDGSVRHRDDHACRRSLSGQGVAGSDDAAHRSNTSSRRSSTRR